jgi:hypothetical protein
VNGFVREFDRQTNRGVIQVARRAVLNRAAQRWWPFELAAVLRGTPTAGASVQFAVCWPSVGLPYATAIEVLGRPTTSERVRTGFPRKAAKARGAEVRRLAEPIVRLLDGWALRTLADRRGH